MQPQATRPGPPVILFEEVSPYGSRKVTVEYDGQVTAAYLHDGTAAISATWIANHGPAPQATDQARLAAGRAPLMPAACTKHPTGVPPLQATALDALWFEEGDGVAIFEYGRPLAVMAGWSDTRRGMPGYSRDVIGQTPFGWSLDDAMEGLAGRRNGPGPTGAGGTQPTGGRTFSAHCSITCCPASARPESTGTPRKASSRRPG